MTNKAQKRAAKLAAAQASVTPPTTVVAEKQAPVVVSKVVGTLVVKDGLNFRGARQAWYDVLKAHDGKPAQEYLEKTTKEPPSMPKSGKQEPSSGWLRWFVRHEVAAIVQTKA